MESRRKESPSRRQLSDSQGGTPSSIAAYHQVDVIDLTVDSHVLNSRNDRKKFQTFEGFEESSNAPKSQHSCKALCLDMSETSHDKKPFISLATVRPAHSLVASAPSKPSEKSDSMDQSRRSGRQCKSTTMLVDGHVVLKHNNYVLKGASYHFGAHKADAPKAKRKGPQKSASPKQTKVPRHINYTEEKRSSFNERVKNRVANKYATRLSFLSENLDVLAPFLEPAIIRKLTTVEHVASKRQPLYLQPEAIQGELRDYQLAGLNWMVDMYRENISCILGDEMGLGKTLQTISLLCHLKEREGIHGPSLVICPLSVIYSWCNELNKWAPSLKFIRFHSSCESERETQRKTIIDNATELDVIITTYEMAKSPNLTSLFRRQHFNLLVLDEGHKIKNEKSQISQAVRAIHRENAMILTGTPLQNNLVELFSLLSFLHPDVFTASEPFATAFDLGENSVNRETLGLAQKMLSIFMKRRLKDEVEKLMPMKIETKVLCPLSSMQIHWYKSLLLKDIRILARNDGDEPTGKNGAVLNNLVMQLRKCCLHPFLFNGAELDIGITSCEDLIAASGKLAVLDMLLLSLFRKKHRTVLFSQFTSILDILEDYCVMRGWQYCRFDGSTSRAKRNYNVNDFNAPDSTKFIFLMSTRSGGMGLNLQSADTCILFDSDWNPQPDLQAMARIHRIGQKKTVHVYRLVTGGTIEERILLRAQKKLFLDKMVNKDSSMDNDKFDNISGSEIMSSLKFGCNAVFGADSDKKNILPTAQEIEIITDRLRMEDHSDGKLKGGASTSTTDFEAEEQFTATTNFGGIDFKAILNELNQKTHRFVPSKLSDVSDMWRSIHNAKRERKSRLVMLAGTGSGYGKAFVPVLAANNYDLDKGECSVFQRELKTKTKSAFKAKKRKVQKSGVDFEEQSFCQVCGDGGTLLCCPRCPVCVHLSCSGVTSESNFLCCSHHRCWMCSKNGTESGGLLFVCQSCPQSFCEDCLPIDSEGFRMIGNCDRFEELGFQAKHCTFIHCSTACESVAIKEFGWKKPSNRPMAFPPVMDVSFAFGNEVDENVNIYSHENLSRLRGRNGK